MSLPATATLPLRQVGQWAILEIRGAEHVPGYDPAEVGKGMSTQARRREVEGDWSATAGKLVYPEFGPLHIARDPLRYDPTRPLVLGWDQGGKETGGTPAAVVTQLSAAGQWLLYSVVIPAEDETVGVLEFAGRVAQHLHEAFAAPNRMTLADLRLIHYGDPAGNAKPSPTLMTGARDEMRSCYDIIRDGMRVVTGHDDEGRPIYEQRPGTGWVIRPAAAQLQRRMETLRGRLTTLLPGGVPALVVDQSATVLLDGFQGGYHYHQRSDGRYELDPQKNWYANALNAVEYAACGLFAAKADDDGGRVWEHIPRSLGQRVQR